MIMKSILVTGGNQGIGYALCKQLVLEHNCHVYLTARNVERGQAAASKISSAISGSSSTGSIDFLQLDTTDESSIKKCKEQTEEKLDGTPLYGIVNNAGIGLNTGSNNADIIKTNLYGPKRVSEQFLPLLDPKEGRIVNLGSGSGPMYVGSLRSLEDKRILCSPENEKVTWEYIEDHAKKNMNNRSDAYGLSKALLAAFTGLYARMHPNIKSSCVSPGFINTQMTEGWGASKSPDQGTLAIKKCLFDDLEGANGWYYGSDGLRSPYHFMRNPGEPVYDGVNPF